MQNDHDADRVRTILNGLVPGIDVIPDDMLDAISRGEHVDYEVDDTGAAYDITQLVHMLHEYVPIISGMLASLKVLHDLGAEKPRFPTAAEIAEEFKKRFGEVPDQVKDDVPRIAEAVASSEPPPPGI